MDNNKTVICRNIWNGNKCSHGNRCVFAHSLKEQVVNKNRKLAYDIINGNINEPVYLGNHPELYSTFLELTKVCKACVVNKCSGGYNCKYGAINTNSVICFNELTTGKCQVNNCQNFHLSKQGVILNHVENNFDSDSDDEEEIEKIRKYLNSE